MKKLILATTAALALHCRLQPPRMSEAPKSKAAAKPAAKSSRRTTKAPPSARSPDGRQGGRRSDARREEVDVALSEADWRSPSACTSVAPSANSAPTYHRPTKRSPASSPSPPRGLRYRMHPVESRTGAIRLEDPRAGAHVAAAGQQVDAHEPEAGLRIADECQNAEQVAFAEEMKKNPPKPLFEGADRASCGHRRTAAPAAPWQKAPPRS